MYSSQHIYGLSYCVCVYRIVTPSIGFLLTSSTPDDNRDQFHTVHHKNVKLNFGQYLTLWDHLGGTYADAERYFIGKGDNRTVKI